MRSLRQTAPALAWPSLHDARGRLLGLPFVLLACARVVFGWQACIAALIVASVASFLVYVPMTALALNGGDALSEEAPVPALTARAYGVLLLLWTASAWLGAPPLRTSLEGHPDVEEYRVVVAGVAAAKLRAAPLNIVYATYRRPIFRLTMARPPTPGKVIQVPGTIYRGAVR